MLVSNLINHLISYILIIEGDKMQFIEISKEEYRKFWEDHPLKSFLSAPEIGDLRKSHGWDVYYVAVKDEENIIAASLLLGHKRHFGKYEFYAPRGILADFLNEEVLKFFLDEISQFVKSHSGYKFRMDPYLIYKERDLNGDVVEGGVDHSSVVSFL